MIDPKLTFSKLLSNYLFCKSIDQFFNNKNGFCETADYVFSKGLVESADHDISTNIQFKIAISYLINQYAAYLKTNSEEAFYLALTTLFNHNLDRLTSVDLLSELREVTIKKTLILKNQNFFKKYEEEITRIIDQHIVLLKDVGPEEEFDNESFYEELTKILKSKVDSKNSSVLFEITKTYDLDKDQDEESELLNIFLSFQRRKVKDESNSDEPSSRKHLKKEATRETPSLFNQSSKKMRFDEDEKDDDELPNIEVNMQNNDELPPSSPSIPIQQTESNFVFDDPSMPRLNESKTTEKKANEQNKIDQKYSKTSKNLNEESDSEEELNFKVSPRKKKKSLTVNKVINAIVKDSEKRTSSPVPTTSKMANKISKLDSDSDSSTKSNEKTKENIKKDSRKTTSSRKQILESDDEEKEEKKSVKPKRKSIQKKDKKDSFKLSDLSNIESDSETDKKPSKSFVQQKRTKWTDQETIYLVVGVELYGKGNWAKILKRFSDKLKNRSSVHLKDKYRNLERANELKRFEKYAKTFIEKNNIEME
ncbi:unnamed protein product [Brachionus calyciflorus]|uniref:Myb-like domain-containing protein n=1 Tax=Brachionus calyciflorus TaxID=104777 RepID=A0A813N1Y2_9BILA|nr:unnamed protein product [Brachionus calyciflorus]